MRSWHSHLQIVRPSSGERGGGYLALDRIQSLQFSVPVSLYKEYIYARFCCSASSSEKDAIEITAKDENKGGAGRYVAIPNEWWIAQNVTVKKIAEVNMEPQEMV
jgi:hypothetical protein